MKDKFVILMGLSVISFVLSSTLFQYYVLIEEHYNLKAEYNELQRKYNLLRGNFSALKLDYINLQADYSTLEDVFNSPLDYEKTPTLLELERWLEEDETDRISYSYPNFICGDFAVMLSQHAKLKGWDMGIVAIRGYTEDLTSYAHAINAIKTVEGLVYIEPQDDSVWWYEGHQEIDEYVWFEIGDTWVYVQDVIIVVSYD
jgi:hypothetical protein